MDHRWTAAPELDLCPLCESKLYAVAAVPKQIGLFGLDAWSTTPRPGLLSCLSLRRRGESGFARAVRIVEQVRGAHLRTVRRCLKS
jgi:hypothetical protein